MKCPNCTITIKPHYIYCPNCGTRLKARAGRPTHTIGYTILLILLLASGVYLYFQRSHLQHYFAPHFSTKAKSHPAANADRATAPRVWGRAPATPVQSVRLTGGTVTIKDIAGNVIARVPAAVSNSGWIALPERICLGGYDWQFHSSGSKDSGFIGGIIGDRDKFGLWQLEDMDQNAGPPLSTGKMDETFKWVSILSEHTVDLTRPAVLSENLNYDHISMPESIDAPGVLMQNGRIVGWTFGDLLPGGYVWKGPGESNLVYEMTVSDFYRSTFQGGREEQFILGYAKKDNDPLGELERFANGLRLEPKLPPGETPQALEPRVVVSHMQSLIPRLIQKGYAYDIGTTMDGTVLKKAASVPLLVDVVHVVADNRGPAAAVSLIESVLPGNDNFKDSQVKQIKGVLKDSYKKWLAKLMKDGSYDRGFEVYEQASRSLPDDPDLRLFGIRFALAANDGSTAERLLNNYDFPADMTDQVEALAEKVSELKNRRNRIVVHFRPGYSTIPVLAVLNNGVSQNFLVDTGATMTTIPSATARQMGLNLNGVAPLRMLATAGGRLTAPEVVIDSIQVGGWVEHNVKALIVDMPDKQGYGLLGLNYLHRFRMDLNAKTGTLTLTPR